MILLKVLYSNKKTEEICEDFAKAKRFFGGKEILAISLLSRINAINEAETLDDIRVQPNLDSISF